MRMVALFVLTCLLSLSSALDKNSLETIRLYHEHDGIDTATVHISYPHAPHLRRLTKREALNNLKGLPGRPRNFTVKVTLESLGHVLDLDLQRSRLQADRALVTVMKEGGSEEFHVQDEGCHYQGFFDDNMGMASVHFCDGVLMGGAHNGHTEYHFHSHHHPLLGHSDEDDPATSAEEGELYHTIVSWRNASKDWETVPTPRDTVSLVEEKQTQQRHRRQADPEEEENSDDLEEDDLVAPSGGADDSNDPDPHGDNVPVAELGVIFDEDFLRDRAHWFPTRRDLIHFLMYKYTGVQALYGNPEVTGFNMIFHIKLIYLWHKNPSWYGGSSLPIGQRMGAGSKFSKENAQYRSVDLGALYTSQAPGNVEGMAYLGGACLNRGKTFVTRSKDLNWITECHELGHELGLNHNCPGVVSPPWDRGFLNSWRQMFLPCYTEILEPRLQRKGLQCFFTKNVNTTNIPQKRFARTWPILALGYNYHCGLYFNPDSVFAYEEDKPCGSVLCAVLDERSTEFGMAQITSGTIGSLSGRSCGPNGMICLDRACKLPETNTTVTARDDVKGTGTWSQWSNYASDCTSACGVGVQLSYRTCSNKDRPEACTGGRYRAKLCNTRPCPGDDLKSEQKLRWDRKNYMCSLLKARGGNYSQYILPEALPMGRKEITSPITMKSCMATCRTNYTGGPPLQRRMFGTIIQVDGAPCGPVNTYDRVILGVTTRCLHGRCLEFGCDGFSMENRNGKVKDRCGVCGGDNSACNNGQTTISLSRGQKRTVVILPAGTKDILFTVKSSPAKLALTTKEDTFVIAPGKRGRFKITDNEMNPLNFAGTHWTTVDNEILTAPGPLDRPVKIKVQLMNSGSGNAVVVWRYQLPETVPPPPTCENNGEAMDDLGGCICMTSNTHGKQCEYRCGFDLCYNGGHMTTRQCRCNCTDTVRTNPSARCSCRKGFAGPDCTECAIEQCYNGGVHNASTCQCQCPEGCDGKPDCSDCNFNPLMPWYRGQYGRGSLELMGKKTSSGGQSSVHCHAGFSVCNILVAVWFFSKLLGVQLL